MSRNRTITLKSSDGETFEVDELVALKSQVIKSMIEVDCADNEIPLPNVTSEILSKVIEYCKKHVEASNSEDRTATGVDDDLRAWDAEFVKVDQSTLFDLILAANYLNIQSLLHLTCQTFADMIKGKTTKEMRKILHIKNDFTPEEEIRMNFPVNFKEVEDEKFVQLFAEVEEFFQLFEEHEEYFRNFSPPAYDLYVKEKNFRRSINYIYS